MSLEKRFVFVFFSFVALTFRSDCWASLRHSLRSLNEIHKKSIPFAPSVITGPNSVSSCCLAFLFRSSFFQAVRWWFAKNNNNNFKSFTFSGALSVRFHSQAHTPLLHFCSIYASLAIWLHTVDSLVCASNASIVCLTLVRNVLPSKLSQQLQLFWSEHHFVMQKQKDIDKFSPRVMRGTHTMDDAICINEQNECNRTTIYVLYVH